MAMTSGDIRKALKPMADFAPAVLRALEIIESTEAAEREMVELGKAKEAIIDETAKLQELYDLQVKRTGDVRREHNAAVEKAAIDKQALKDDLKPLKAEIAAQQQALADAQKQAQEQLDFVKNEIAAATSIRDGIKADIDSLRNRLNAA